MGDANPWRNVASAYAWNNPELGALCSGSLPDADFKSMYACDLSIVAISRFGFENFGIKGFSRFKPNPEWKRLLPILCFAYCLGQFIVLSENTRALTSSNVAYLRNQLEMSLPGVSELIPACDGSVFSDLFEPARFFAVTIGHLDRLVERCGLRYESGDGLERMIRLAGMLGGLMSALNYQASTDFAEVLSGDFLKPLRA